MAKELQCSFSDPRIISCQFRCDCPLDLYIHDGDIFCLFHAPLEAEQLNAPGKKKKDADPETFNRSVLDYVLRRQEQNPNYEPKRRQFATRTAKVIGGMLEDRFLSSVLSDLSGTIFPGAFRCKEMTFVDVKFTGCLFAGEVEFQSCTFRHRVSFSFATFSQSAWFCDCTFESTAHFEHCKFGEWARFDDAVFKARVIFDASEFKSAHICAGATQQGNGISSLELNSTKFDGFLCLRHRQIEELKLKGTVFNEAPIFATCSVGDDVVFNTAIFRDTSPDRGNRYAVLRRLALGTGDLVAADRFRGLRFDCQSREAGNPKFARLLLRAYGTVSSYGTNAARPIRLLALLSLACFLLYFGIGQLRLDDWSVALSDAAWFTLRQIVHPFDATGHPGTATNSAWFDNPPWGLAIVAAVQSTLTLVLLGVFLQAIYRVFNKD